MCICCYFEWAHSLWAWYNIAEEERFLYKQININRQYFNWEPLHGTFDYSIFTFNFSNLVVSYRWPMFLFYLMCYLKGIKFWFTPFWMETYRARCTMVWYPNLIKWFSASIMFMPIVWFAYEHSALQQKTCLLDFQVRIRRILLELIRWVLIDVAYGYIMDSNWLPIMNIDLKWAYLFLNSLLCWVF